MTVSVQYDVHDVVDVAERSLRSSPEYRRHLVNESAAGGFLGGVIAFPVVRSTRLFGSGWSFWPSFWEAVEMCAIAVLRSLSLTSAHLLYASFAFRRAP